MANHKAKFFQWLNGHLWQFNSSMAFEINRRLLAAITALYVHTLHYGNIFEYLSLWSEVQSLKIQKSKKIQEIQRPN